MSDEEKPEPPEWDKFVHEKGWELSTGDYDPDELSPPDWITDLDREICALLGSGIVLTPALIAKNIDRPRSSVSRRLNTLEAGGIVEKVERGHYKLSEEGFARMLETVETEGPDGGNWYTTKILRPEEAEHGDE